MQDSLKQQYKCWLICGFAGHQAAWAAYYQQLYAAQAQAAQAQAQARAQAQAGQQGIGSHPITVPYSDA